MTNPAANRKIYFSLTAALLAFFGLMVWGDARSILANFRQFSWSFLPLILLLAFGNYLIRFFKWQLYLAALGFTINRATSLLIFLSGLAFSITPAKLGEVFKSYLLKSTYSIPMSQTAPIVIVDRLTDFIGVLLLVSIGVFVFHYGLWLFLLIAALIIILIIILSSATIANRLISLLGRIKFLARLTPHLQTAWQSSAILIKPRPLLITTLLSLVAWSAECLGFWLVFRGLGITAISLSAAFFIYAFSTLLGAISMIPGGLGLQEASMAGLLMLMSLPKASAATATLIIRACTLWFAVILGAIVLLISQKRLGAK